MIEIFQLPSGAPAPAGEQAVIPGTHCAAPRLLPADIDNTVGALRGRRDNLLARDAEDILSVLDAAAEMWMDPAYELRRFAVDNAAAHSRFSPEMIDEGVRIVFSGLSRRHVRRALENEIGDLRALDGFSCEGPSCRRIYAPHITALICAGNIPGVSLISLAQLLMLKSAVLLRVSASDPLLPSFFVRSLREVDSAVADCAAVLWWERADSTLMETALRGCDAAVAYGSDETLESLRKRTDRPFVGYGHKVSFELIAREAPGGADALAAGVARDVSLFDQHGCLSPHVVYVEEGGALSPETFAGCLAREMGRFAESIPPGKLGPGEAGRIMQMRGAAEFRDITGKGARVWCSEGGAKWTVLYESDPSFVLSCLNRTVWVKPLDSLDRLRTILAPWRRYLQSAGVAAPRDRWMEIAALLGDAGVNRMCPAGTMQEPGPDWRHDGRCSLAGLVGWMDVEGTGP